MNGKLKIKNSQFGNIEIEKDNIIYFPDGLLGFEDVKKFTILTLTEYEPFQWLVGVEEDITFPIVSPLLVLQDYDPVITRDQMSVLGDFDEKNLLMYLIVTINSQTKKTTANLRGPLIINMENKKGVQIVLEEELSTEFQFI